MAVGERIREEREKRGWTQGDLGEHSGTNRDTISGIESGRHRPRPSTLQKIAGAYGIEVRELFEDAARPKEAQAPLPLDPALLEDWQAGHDALKVLERAWDVHQRELGAWRQDGNRAHLEEIGKVLQDAYDTVTGLLESIPDAQVSGTSIKITPQNPEQVQKLEVARMAHLFYRALVQIVEGHGLRVVTSSRPGAATRPLEVVSAA